MRVYGVFGISIRAAAEKDPDRGPARAGEERILGKS